jgi:hypothetical protein
MGPDATTVLPPHGIHDRVVKTEPELGYCLVLSRGMYSIGKEYHNNPLREIHPERSPGKAKMADTII